MYNIYLKKKKLFIFPLKINEVDKKQENEQRDKKNLILKNSLQARQEPIPSTSSGSAGVSSAYAN